MNLTTVFRVWSLDKASKQLLKAQKAGFEKPFLDIVHRKKNAASLVELVTFLVTNPSSHNGIFPHI
jgi:hypothetical protein